MKKQPGSGILMAAFLLSGMAALGYELLWTRLLSLVLGSEGLAVSGVLLGFFAGMASGSWILDRRLSACRNPAYWFVVLECIAALYALASPFFLTRLQLFGGGLVLKVFMAGLCLLPATFCMGATLAALTHAYRRAYPNHVMGYGVGRLYAANTLGAMLGVLGALHVLMPALGFMISAMVLAAIGFASAGLGAVWGRDLPEPEQPEMDEPETRRKEPSWVYLFLFLTGFSGIGFEVVGLQVLSQLLHGTIYTFAHALAVFLIATSIGARLYAIYLRSEFHHRRSNPLAFLLWLYAFSLLASAVLLRAFAHKFAGDIQSLSLGREVLVTVLFFGPPSLCMGALFSHLAGRLSKAIGKAYAWNTCGAALAPILLGTLFVHQWGYTMAYLLIVGLIAVLYLASAWISEVRLLRIGLGVILLVAGFFAMPRPMHLVKSFPGWETIHQKEGVMGTVIVSELSGTKSGPPIRRLQVNQRFYMGGQYSFGERRMGHLPFLLAPRTERALFLGVGTGATLSAVKSYAVGHADAVEIAPDLVEVLPWFDDINDQVYQDPRVSVHVADARQFLQAATNRYDLIVADLYHPFKDGVAFLYTVEYYEAVATRLNDQGLFVQWLPLYQLDFDTLQMLMRTFLAVYDDTSAYLGIYNARMPVLALVGMRGTDVALHPMNLEVLKLRLGAPGIRSRYFAGPSDLLGSYVMGRQRLEGFAGIGPVNRDMHPHVLFRARKMAQESASRGARNLEKLLDARNVRFRSLVTSSDSNPAHLLGDQQAYATYVDAVDQYLAADILWVLNGGQEPPPEVIDGYFEACKTDPAFTPAMGMLIQLAALYPEHAESIYPRLLNLNPKSVRVYQVYLAYLKRINRPDRFQDIMRRAKRELSVDKLRLLLGK